MSTNFMLKITAAALAISTLVLGFANELICQSSLSVTTIDDSGPGSLRQAILDANSTAGLDTIEFDIPGTGLHVISLASPLPEVTAPLAIDATTEPDFTGVPVIQLNGSLAGSAADGLRVSAGASRISGLAITGFRNGIVLTVNPGTVVQSNYIGLAPDGVTEAGNRENGVLIWASSENQIGGEVGGTANIISGNADNGIRITQIGSMLNRVQGNLIGTDGNGSFSVGNGLNGVSVDSSASGNVIGGLVSGSGNIISGNAECGVIVRGNGTDENLVIGNGIGVNRSGDDELPNSFYGVLLDEGAARNTIGGTESGSGNVIVRNGFSGIALMNATTNNNRVLGNHVGVDATGALDLPNDVHGIVIEDASNNIIGGAEAGAGNHIAFNAGDGVRITAGIGNSVVSNRIFANNDLGIDIGGNGATVNDTEDSDDGANRFQNHPEIIDVGLSGSELVLTYSVDSAPANSTYPLTVQFFQADERGQGRTHLGEHTYREVDFSSGQVSTNLGTVDGIAADDKLVATATDAAGNTSEFSPPASIRVITTVAEKAPQVPGTFLVHQNYPNPFNPETAIEFELSAPAKVELNIYNILGTKIRTLVDDSLSAGPHRAIWDGRDSNGLEVSSAIYLYHFKTATSSEVRKMTLLR